MLPGLTPDVIFPIRTRWTRPRRAPRGGPRREPALGDGACARAARAYLSRVARWSEIEARLRAAKVPGCAIATTRGERFFFGSASIAPERPVDATTRFHLFSGTKLYTASAVMRLVERGDLSLDEPVRSYLPELPLAHPVTPRQLLSHSSGLRDTLRAFLAVHPGGQPGPSTGEALARYRLDRARPPGAVRYTNVAFAVLGELISRVCGAPYERFVREALLEPLGAELDFEARASDAVGYVPRLSPMRLALRLLLPDVHRWVYAGVAKGFVALRPFALDTAAVGGLVGPVEAYLPLLGEMLSEEDGLLRASSKREMLTLQARGAAGVVSREGVGLGWKRGPDFWNHEGGGPGFCTETRIYPRDALGVVILMNRPQTRGLSRACHELCEIIRRG